MRHDVPQVLRCQRLLLAICGAACFQGPQNAAAAVANQYGAYQQGSPQQIMVSRETAAHVEELLLRNAAEIESMLRSSGGAPAAANPVAYRGGVVGPSGPAPVWPQQPYASQAAIPQPAVAVRLPGQTVPSYAAISAVQAPPVSAYAAGSSIGANSPMMQMPAAGPAASQPMYVMPAEQGAVAMNAMTTPQQTTWKADPGAFRAAAYDQQQFRQIGIPLEASNSRQGQSSLLAVSSVAHTMGVSDNMPREVLHLLMLILIIVVCVTMCFCISQCRRPRTSARKGQGSPDGQKVIRRHSSGLWNAIEEARQMANEQDVYHETSLPHHPGAAGGRASAGPRGGAYRHSLGRSSIGSSYNEAWTRVPRPQETRHHRRSGGGGGMMQDGTGMARYSGASRVQQVVHDESDED